MVRLQSIEPETDKSLPSFC